MKLGIASKAKQEAFDNKLFINALAFLSLKKKKKCQNLFCSPSQGEITTEQKECCLHL
jgi:hypothetical protein